MAIQTKTVKDAAGASITIATSDLIGGGTLANATFLLNGTTEVGQTNPLPVAGRIIRPASAGLTLASLSASPYAANDLMANSGTAGSVVPFSWNVGRAAGFIRRIMLTSSRNTAPSGTPILRLHLWTGSPTFSNGDNGAFLSTGLAAGAANYLGAFDFVSSREFSDGYAFMSGQPIDGSEQNFVIASGTTLYGALTVSPNSPSTYTPYHASTAEVWYAYPEVHLF